MLTGALPHLKEGHLPNIYGPTDAESHYGSLDAALWFARAVLLYDRAGGDRGLLRGELGAALTEIAETWIAGTGLGVAVDEDGIVTAGSAELNPTWMDARTSEGPVTPRHGAPVEINALWYSLLAHLEELAVDKTATRDAKRWRALRRRARKAFLARFWLEDEGYLADVWRPDGSSDASVRPNMVLAASLEASPLTRAQRGSIVERANAELLTPVGLRTLSPSDPHYAPRFEGGPDERDGAYHQGTVWPWLLGAWVEASLRAFGRSRAVRDDLRAKLSGLEPELERAGLLHVSEVFDGDAPHRPGGTIAQAWNTAELLRAFSMLERK